MPRLRCRVGSSGADAASWSKVPARSIEDLAHRVGPHSLHIAQAPARLSETRLSAVDCAKLKITRRPVALFLCQSLVLFRKGALLGLQRPFANRRGRQRPSEMTSPAARLPVRMLRLRVAACRLQLMKTCVSCVGTGAFGGRDAIQRSAWSKTGSGRNKRAIHWRSLPAAGEFAEFRMRLIQTISVSSACAKRSAFASKRDSSGEKTKFSLASSCGTDLS